MRDMQFREIYHPETGLPYGGIQEDNDGKLIEWKSTERQTWTASGYFRVLVEDIVGLTLTKDGIQIAPNVPHAMPHIRLENLHIRGVNYKVEIIGTGNQLKGIEVNGSPVTGNKIPYAKSGVCRVRVWMG
jgi:cellobiose phosphorylase